uniref:Uncharacterized protein n=1 Tax=Rhizophagus irregularis (strain DAOM 181602 / DAOM 197198 / MUCL 43194) TaxID=747089 RepID=U9TAF1_RHIID
MFTAPLMHDNLVYEKFPNTIRLDPSGGVILVSTASRGKSDTFANAFDKEKGMYKQI